MLDAVTMMLAVGATLGLALGLAAKFLYVEPDTRVEQLLNMLPGYNCGACGYPGCSGLAEALASGEANSPSLCKPSTEAHRTRITAFLETGIDPQAVSET
jgi:Na+-translocating ferredoxin:NAD+ oxidoreductase subunit B